MKAKLRARRRVTHDTATSHQPPPTDWLAVSLLIVLVGLIGVCVLLVLAAY